MYFSNPLPPVSLSGRLGSIQIHKKLAAKPGRGFRRFLKRQKSSSRSLPPSLDCARYTLSSSRPRGPKNTRCTNLYHRIRKKNRPVHNCEYRRIRNLSASSVFDLYLLALGSFGRVSHRSRGNARYQPIVRVLNLELAHCVSSASFPGLFQT